MSIIFNKQLQEFKKYIVKKPIESKASLYEFSECENAQNDKFLLLSLFQTNEQILQQFFKIQIKIIIQPVDAFKIDNAVHLLFKRDSEFKRVDDLIEQFSEAAIWEWATQLSQLLIQLRRNKLVVQQFRTGLMFQNNDQMQFFSFADLISSEDSIKDITALGQLLQKLAPKNLSLPLQYLIKATKEAIPKITLEELNDHPILHPIESKKIISAQTRFQLSEFKFIKELGTGAFGRCDLAIFIPSQEQVVIKSTTNTRAQDIEVAVLQAVSHPNVVRFYGSFTEARTHYIVMQYCEGGDLFDKLTSGQLPTPQTILEWLAQLCSAIYYMHSHHLIHRDVKPQNVLISKGQALLADFGVSRAVEEYAQTVVGTPLYFSPEQHYKQNYTLAADIFSLGLVFFNMCVGSHPFTSQAQDAAQFYNYVKKHGNANAYCNYIKNQELRQLISQMLTYDPKTRATAADLCRQPMIIKYLEEHGLPGPGLSTMLTSPRVIAQGSDLTQTLCALQKAQKTIFEKYLLQKSACGQYFQLCCELAPYYLQYELRKHTQDKSLYHEYIIKQGAKEVWKQLTAEHGIREPQLPATFQSGAVLKDGQKIIQIGSITNDFQSGSEVNINLSPAMYLSQDVTLKSKVIIVVCSHLIVDKNLTLTLQADDLCIFGFQRNMSEHQLNLKAGNGFVFVDKINQNKIVVNKEATVLEFKEITKKSQEVNKIIGLINLCFPIQFAGKKGFYIDGQGWE